MKFGRLRPESPTSNFQRPTSNVQSQEMPEAQILSRTELDDTPPGHRSGFVAVVGKPNVGKSTLLNAILGQKIAIVSNKPQTTRTRLRGILTRPAAQIIFVDTPGIHQPRHRLDEHMVESAVQSIPDADAIVFGNRLHGAFNHVLVQA